VTQPWLAACEAIAPVRLAGSWDNVGLLLEGTREVRRIFVCIDLTEPVLDEAMAWQADAIVAYHPTIFGGLKRITEGVPLQRSVLRMVREGLWLYAPHTALDAAAGGMNDWLLEAFGACSDVVPLDPDALDPSVGVGRGGTLSAPRSLHDVVARVKAHLGLAHVRVAASEAFWSADAPVKRVAVCPGAGGSVFAPLKGYDLFLTGEMRHHDVLARVAAGAAVILTDHTNTERGYLPRYAQRLAETTGLEVKVSALDADPLRVV